MLPAYSKNCLQLQAGYNLVQKVSEGRSNISVEEGSGHPVQIPKEV